MPLSIAACRTVLPFWTVTCRPSIVSVTVSISSRSYQEKQPASPKLAVASEGGKLAGIGARRRLDNGRRAPRLTNLTMYATRSRLSFERDHVNEHVQWAVVAALVA